MIAAKRQRAHELGRQSDPEREGRLLQVLCVIESGPWRPTAATRTAVTLAEEAGARLTLVKTTAATWYTGLGLGAGGPFGMSVPVEPFQNQCATTLQQATRHVPAWVPLETLLLGAHTTGSLVQLLRRRNFDAVVAGEQLLRRRLVRRELVRLGVQEVVPFGMELRASRRDRQAARASVRSADESTKALGIR